MAGRRLLRGKSADWFRRPAGAAIWWGLPLLLGVATNVFSETAQTASFVWAVVFAWMAGGCILNAMRCGRVHCYISGPTFVLGALACGAIGLGVIHGPHVLSNTVSATLVAVLLSFIPEWFWRRYV